MKNRLAAGHFDSVFADLYPAGGQINFQRERYGAALDAFAAVYGTGRDVAVYSAPGRTEIGGNHTDHNNGLVLAAAVDLDIIAVVAKADGDVVRLTSEGFSGEDIVDLNELSPVANEEGASAGLIRGVAAGISARGGTVGGFDAYTTSKVLRGSGLSSSAAFEICLGEIFNGEYNNARFGPLELAIIGQHAENVFFGKPSGLLDQTACAVGGAVLLDFRDPKAPQVESIPFDLQKYGLCLVITDTKGSHADLTPDYAEIRAGMERVAAYFGKPVLREVDPAAFFADVAGVRDACGDRAALRAIHFFSECARVPQMANAIKRGDIPAFLALVTECGHSSFEYNQNAYSIRHPNAQGVPLGLALTQRALAGKGAYRLQGGGFAGTIQAFVPQACLEAYCDALEAAFGAGACHVLSIRAKGSVRVL